MKHFVASFFKLKKNSIQKRLFRPYVFLVSFFVLLITLSVYKVSEIIIEQQVGKSRMEVLEQIGKNVNGIANEIISASNLY